MNYLARSAALEDLPPQSYLKHVLHVLVRGRCYLRKALRYAHGLDADARALLRILELASEYHDLGKLFDENQEVLSGQKRTRPLPVRHTDAGVAFLLQRKAYLSALLIYAHHAGLPDAGKIHIDGMRNPKIAQRVDQELPLLLSRHEASVRPQITPKDVCDLQGELQPADMRILFSCLTHADHGDAARASGECCQLGRSPKLRANERLEALKRHVRLLASDGEATDRNHMRSAFFNACSDRDGPESEPITICDAPVGTGKTTSVMAYLLDTAARHGLRRIFVILPFTNIISQSVTVYRKALTLEGEKGEEVVAEIHHKADFASWESRKLTALWDAPIVVTTAVAFFETLASASPATLRRLQNLPGSAVFLDEAHAMLPVKLLPLAWRWIQHMATTWGCRWVLASGSLCHFWKLDEFRLKNGGETAVTINNILPVEQQKILQAFEINRVRYRYKPEEMRLVELIEWLKELEWPVLVVLNTVHTAAAAAKIAKERLGEDYVMHLSTALTPEDRDRTLKEVEQRLLNKADKNWCLFATSCVEAGMDMSFRTGVRECASLLSLLQLAGRVNRNAEKEKADVWTILLNTTDPCVTKNPAFDVSSRILRDFLKAENEISPALCTDSMRREIRETGATPKELCDHEDKYAFKAVEQKFRVIEDDSKIAVADKALIERIKNYEDVSWQEIQRYSVRIRQKIVKKLAIEESRYPGLLLWTAEYTPFLGYMEAVLKMEEFDEDGYAMM
jgi:CRISPR/Cas system-associated endonuclease/helicase Cas3